MHYHSIKKFGAGAFAAIMTGALLLPGVSAFAQTNYTPISGGTTTFKQFLITDAGAQIPNASFSFSISAGTARSADTADNESMEVLAGPGTPTAGNAVFAPTDTSYTAVQTGDSDIERAASERGVSLSAANGVEFVSADGEKYAVKEVTVDFSSVSFGEPGIYRYVIAEDDSSANSAAGIMHDNDSDRILDVYVTDDGSGALAISSYVMHTDDDDVVLNTTMGSADVATASAALADKTDGFTAKAMTSDLVFKKEVSGNQASRDKYFDFTLSLDNLTPGNIYTVSLSDDGNDNTTDGLADATSGSNSATISANRSKANLTQITADKDGAATVHYYLQHGQSIAVRGLPINATYEVEENAEDYKSTAASVSGYTDAASGDMSQSRKTSYTNERNGVIPTGVILSIIPGGLALACAGGGLLLTRKRKRARAPEA